MSDRLRIDDEFIPLPPSAVDADPVATMRELFFRISRLEHAMEEQRVQAATDLGEVLVEVASLTDDIHRIVERWGVSRNAQEAALIRSVVALAWVGSWGSVSSAASRAASFGAARCANW